MRSMFLLITGGVLFTTVFVGGVAVGALGLYALAKDDIDAGHRINYRNRNIVYGATSSNNTDKENEE